MHADLDAFYASVEQLLDPSLRGKPIAVGGGVVLAASYEARAHGVRAGMPGWRAQKLCPGIQFVGGHFRRYQQLGDQVVGIFRDFTPLVERVSIDEAFLDVAGSVRLFGAPEAMAIELRRRVRAEVGLPVSVGVARTKHLAKIGSQVAKPDGLVVIPPDHELDFLGPLPVGLVWGVGEVTRERLAAKGISTIGELAATDPSVLQGLLGDAAGAKLGALATNADPRKVETSRPVHSVGAQSALGRAVATPEVVRETLAFLADRVAGRMRAAGRAGRTITVRVRLRHMRSVTRSITLSVPIATTLTLTEIAVELAWEGIGDEEEISLLGVSVSNLVDQPGLQLEMEVGEEDRWRPGSATGAARWASDRSIDAIRAKFGRGAVGYAAVMLSDASRVPDEFRELAEGGGPY